MSPTTATPSPVDAAPAADAEATAAASPVTPPREVRLGTHAALQLLRRSVS